MIDQLIKSLWWFALFAFVVAFILSDGSKTADEEKPSMKLWSVLWMLSMLLAILCYTIRPWL